MRNAKFRAWYDGKMYPYNEITTYKDGSSACTTISEDGMLRYSPDIDKIVIEQYTGLKDKNGKEIYEGDILQGDSFVPHLIIGYSYDKASFVGSKSLDYSIENIYNFYDDIVLSDGWEVIGNIHENPEFI